MITINQNSISYQVTVQDQELATKLAEESCNKYSKLVLRKKSPYNQNNLKSHLVGKIGEVASGNVFVAIKEMMDWPYDIEQIYLDSNRDSSCDIIINGLRIEIKTWRPCDWKKYSACISERQAVKLHHKADVVVYGTYDKDTNEYLLLGFNTVQDIMEVEPVLTGPKGKQVLNRIMLHRSITDLPLYNEIPA